MGHLETHVSRLGHRLSVFGFETPALSLVESNPDMAIIASHPGEIDAVCNLIRFLQRVEGYNFPILVLIPREDQGYYRNQAEATLNIDHTDEHARRAACVQLPLHQFQLLGFITYHNLLAAKTER